MNPDKHARVTVRSLERIQGYLEIEQEPKPTTCGLPPAAWPTSGHLRVDNLTARYSKVNSNIEIIRLITHVLVRLALTCCTAFLSL
jgi:hypothetical protein